MSSTKARVRINQLGINRWVHLIDDSLSALSLGLQCYDLEYSNSWPPRGTVKLIKEDKVIECDMDHFVPVVAVAKLRDVTSEVRSNAEGGPHTRRVKNARNHARDVETLQQRMGCIIFKVHRTRKRGGPKAMAQDRTNECLGMWSDIGREAERALKFTTNLKTTIRFAVLCGQTSTGSCTQERERRTNDERTGLEVYVDRQGDEESVKSLETIQENIESAAEEIADILPKKGQGESPQKIAAES